MSITWNTIGHKLPKQYLNNAVTSNRLAQAYLFVGPESVGKTSLALDLAANLLKKESRDKLIGVDADFILIDQAEEIKIHQIRALKQRLGLKSMTGGKKVAVVAGAEKMNKESANSFLKILEEPSGDTIFILTASIPGRLPSTVLSRTQKLYFAKSSPVELQEFMDSRPSVTKNLKEKASKLCFGRIGVAHRLLEDREAMQECLEWKEAFGKVLEGDISANLISSSIFAKNETVKLNEMLNFWLMLAEDQFVDLIPEFDEGLRGFFLALDTSLQDLGRNLNKKLVLDNLFLQTNLI